MNESEDPKVPEPSSHGITGTSVVSAIKDQVSCDLAGEAAILDLRSGVYYGLDPVGARIWDLLREPVTVNDIRDTLVEEFDVEQARCELDLFTLLNQLADAGLIQVEEKGP